MPLIINGDQIVMRAELIKIVMRVEHENVNCSLHFRAELIKTGMHVEHANVNSLHFHAELIKIVMRVEHENVYIFMLN